MFISKFCPNLNHNSLKTSQSLTPYTGSWLTFWQTVHQKQLGWNMVPRAEMLRSTIPPAHLAHYSVAVTLGEISFFFSISVCAFVQ